MQVKEVMTRDVHSCQQDQTLHEAAEIMWQYDCGCLPVTDPVQDNRVVATITDRDIAMGAYLNGRSLRDIRVRDVMSKGLHACRPEDEIGTTQKTMADAQVRRLPVVDAQERIVGFIGLGALARMASERGKDVTEAQVGQTLASICQPSSV